MLSLVAFFTAYMRPFYLISTCPTHRHVTDHLLQVSSFVFFLLGNFGEGYCYFDTSSVSFVFPVQSHRVLIVWCLANQLYLILKHLQTQAHRNFTLRLDNPGKPKASMQRICILTNSQHSFIHSISYEHVSIQFHFLVKLLSIPIHQSSPPSGGFL